MKPLTLLLCASLAANAAVAVLHLRSAANTSATRAAASGERAGSGSDSAGGATGSGGSASPRASGSATGDGAAIARALNTGDAAALRDELRAAGVDEETVKAIVSAQVWKRYQGRMQALQTDPTAKREWWKNDDWWGGQTKEQREQMKALQAEVKAELKSLIGDSDPHGQNKNPWLERQYGYLPAEKRQSLQEIEQDYNELQSELQREQGSFRMPADAEKARLLQEEKRRDLAALLSPEELAEYDARRSRTAQQLRWQMTQMDATEEEYRAIFEIRRDFDERYADYDQFGNQLRARDSSPEAQKARQEAEKAMKEQIKTALGEERYKAYARSQDHDYQMLKNATKRFGLPPDTPSRLYDLRDEVPASATRIANDASLGYDEKKAALAKLAADARQRVRGALGAEVADAYFQNNGMSWLQQLENGNVVTFGEDGNQSYRRLTPPSPKPKPQSTPPATPK